MRERLYSLEIFFDTLAAGKTRPGSLGQSGVSVVCENPSSATFRLGSTQDG